MKETNMERTDYTEAPRKETLPPAGYPVRRRDLPYKIPTLAGVLSGLMPGLGQVYVGYFQLGITIGLIFAGCITVLSSGAAEGIEPLFGISLAFTYLFGIVDAARRATMYNRYLEGLGGEDVLPELASLGWGGSRAGGILLILVGLLLSAKTMLDIDMEWLSDVWPLGLIGLGVWLFLKARRTVD
jgi:hypothetical protein